MPLSLAVVTPTQEALATVCDEVVVPGISGEMDFLPGHVALISALSPGVMTTIRDGRRSNFVVSSGFVEVDHDKVTVLCDACEPVAAIDADRAKRALDEAVQKLKDLGPNDPGYGEAERRRARAQARLDGKARG
ncbi:MAG: ATP synthase F1 subunit epsilon [Myxococcota bacterium]